MLHYLAVDPRDVSRSLAIGHLHADDDRVVANERANDDVDLSVRSLLSVEKESDSVTVAPGGARCLLTK
jgi:hypothetical protein